MKQAEQNYRKCIDDAQDAYRCYLEREVLRTLVNISKYCQGRKAEYLCSMGVIHFRVGDNYDYKGYGAKEMLARIDDALDNHGWSVVPAGLYSAENGKLTC